MTIQDIVQIMEIIEIAYPNFYKSQDNKERKKAANLWAVMFAEDDPLTVAAAVKAFIAADEKGFPPTIGIIKNKIADIKNDGEMAEYEAWNEVKKAVSNGLYGASEEFAKLSPVLQRLVGSPNKLREWAQMESEGLEKVVGSNFMRSYRSRAASEREHSMLPADVKKFIAALSDKMKMPEFAEVTDSEVNERRNDIRRQLGEAQ
jgi:hypothetical protein